MKKLFPSAAAAFLAAFFAVFAAAALSLFLPAGALAAEALDKIIAVVNDEPITRKAVERRAADLIAENVPPEEAEQVALETLIDRRVQLQRAQQRNLSIPDEVLQRRIEEIVAQFGLKDEAELAAAVAEELGISYDEFKEQRREDLLVQSLFFREVIAGIQVQEEEIDQFLKVEAGIAQQRKYRLSHILLTVAEDGSDEDNQRERAELFRRDLLDGADFAELARQYSQGARADSGGDLGFRNEDDLPDVFLAEVQNMDEGDLSEVISTSRGFHLLKLEEVSGGDLRGTVKEYLLAHVLLPADDEALAQEVRRGITDKASFLEAVRAHSVDEQSIGREGEIGYLTEGDLPPYFANVVPAMAEGEISAPVRSPFGWHILRLVKASEEAINIPKLREQARRVLQERRAQAQRVTWQKKIRSEAHIRILDPAFQTDTR